jgi:alpha-beta hydrolase superfamily lysophospholipase
MTQHIQSTIAGPAGMQLFMQAWLPATPKAVLALAHGLGEHSGRYHNLIGELNQRNYAVYACDHFGHGQSPGQRASIDSWEDYRIGIRSLLAHTSASHPDMPLFLLGHSLGGLIVLEYTLHETPQLQGLVVSAPALSTAGISPLVRLASRILSRIAPTFALKTGIDARAISRDAAVQAAYLADPLNSSVGTPRLATETFAAIARVFEQAGKLQIPLLIVHGEADTIVPAESSARFYAAAGSADKRRLSYPNVVHEPHNDLGWQQPVGDIADWLDAHCR